VTSKTKEIGIKSFLLFKRKNPQFQNENHVLVFQMEKQISVLILLEKINDEN
jgi:hypothetical protein